MQDKAALLRKLGGLFILKNLWLIVGVIQMMTLVRSVLELNILMSLAFAAFVVYSAASSASNNRKIANIKKQLSS